MTKYLEEAFWRVEFMVAKKQVEEIFHLIEDVERPLLEVELAESLVREVLEREQEFAEARIYSPEQKYRVGERLVFIKEKGVEYAEVLQTVAAGGLKSDLGRYETVYVRFKGESRWRAYVSDCPSFALRFSIPPAVGVRDGGAREVITPGQLATKFAEVILAEMRRALLEDGRFISHDGKYYLAEDVVPINLDLAEQFFKDAGKPLHPEAILEELFPAQKHARNPAVYLFSLNLALDMDTRRRFARVDKEGISCWMLQAAVPPGRSRYTVTEAALKEGYIEIRPGFRQMLAFYELGPRLIFSVYGDYEIEGQVDEFTNRVYGADLASWYMETDVYPGDTVYIKAPEPGRRTLRLYTEHHGGIRNQPQSGIESDPQRVFLRHRIYRLFIETEQFMHYRELAERLSFSLGVEISSASVEAVLSRASHLFGKLGPSRGLWGLRQWMTHPYDFRLDLTALLLDIGELQLVYRILKQHSQLMHAKEIAEAIAGAYGISPKLLIETNFIDPKDGRLLRLAGWNWALEEWKGEWKQRLHQIDKEFERIDESSRNLHEQRLRLSQADYSINLVQVQLKKKEETLSLLTEKHNELVEMQEKVKERIGVLEIRQSDLQNQEVQALAELKKWRPGKGQHLVLALCGAAASFVFWTIGFVDLGASIAALSLIPFFFAGRAYSKCRKLSSFVASLLLKRRDVESDAKIFCGDLEATAQNIQSAARGLETMRQELREREQNLGKLEQLRRDTAFAIASMEERLSDYDKEALVAEKERLLKLMGEMPQ